MVLLVLLMLLALAAFQHLTGYTRAERACQVRHDRATGPTRALAWGLRLLETDKPPTKPYSCLVTPTSDTTRVFVITFEETPSNEYTVSVRPAGVGDTLLPAAPSTFCNQ
jgi:hypothetical protein